MERTRQETIVRDITDYFCDFCNEQTHEMECEWCHKHVCGKCCIEIDFHTVDCMYTYEHICFVCLELEKEKINSIQEKTISITQEYMKFCSETNEKLAQYRKEIAELRQRLSTMCWDNYQQIKHVWDDRINPKINGIEVEK